MSKNNFEKKIGKKIPHTKGLKIKLKDETSLGKIIEITGLLKINRNSVRTRVFRTFPTEFRDVIQDGCHSCSGARAFKFVLLIYLTESVKSNERILYCHSE